MKQPPAPPEPVPDDRYWRPTGRVRFRSSWFGLLVVEIEESRRIFDPVEARFTPMNWRTQTRWRRAESWEWLWSAAEVGRC